MYIHVKVQKAWWGTVIGLGCQRRGQYRGNVGSELVSRVVRITSWAMIIINFHLLHPPNTYMYQYPVWVLGAHASIKADLCLKNMIIQSTCLDSTSEKLNGIDSGMIFTNRNYMYNTCILYTDSNYCMVYTNKV